MLIAACGSTQLALLPPAPTYVDSFDPFYLELGLKVSARNHRPASVARLRMMHERNAARQASEPLFLRAGRTAGLQLLQLFHQLLPLALLLRQLLPQLRFLIGERLTARADALEART